MSDSGKLILKFLIVFVIFPSIAYLASILSSLVLVWPVTLLPKSSQEVGFTATEMRFVLYLGSEQQPVYSNQFPGFINPEQFSPPARPDFSAFSEMNKVGDAVDPQ